MPRLGHGPHRGDGPQDGGAVLRTGEPLGRGTAKELPGDLPVAPSMHTSREVMIPGRSAATPHDDAEPLAFGPLTHCSSSLRCVAADYKVPCGDSNKLKDTDAGRQSIEIGGNAHRGPYSEVRVNLLS